MSEHKQERVQKIERVYNMWDNEDKAYKVTLTCGHHLFITGYRILNIKSVECKTCGNSGTVNYHE